MRERRTPTPIVARPDPDDAPAVAADAGSEPLREWRRERFCLEYLADANGTQAAIRAGYSPNGADTAARRLLGNAGVRERVDRLRRERSHRLLITADRVLEELAVLAFSDIGDVLAMPESEGEDRPTDDGEAGRLMRNLWRFRDLQDIPPMARRAIQEASDTTTGDGRRRRTLKLFPKVPALLAIAEHTRVLVRRVEHSGPAGGPIQLRDAPLTAEQATKRLAEIVATAQARHELTAVPGVAQTGALAAPLRRADRPAIPQRPRWR